MLFGISPESALIQYLCPIDTMKWTTSIQSCFQHGPKTAWNQKKPPKPEAQINVDFIFLSLERTPVWIKERQLNVVAVEGCDHWGLCSSYTFLSALVFLKEKALLQDNSKELKNKYSTSQALLLLPFLEPNPKMGSTNGHTQVSWEICHFPVRGSIYAQPSCTPLLQLKRPA